MCATRADLGAVLCVCIGTMPTLSKVSFGVLWRLMMCFGRLHGEGYKGCTEPFPFKHSFTLGVWLSSHLFGYVKAVLELLISSPKAQTINFGGWYACLMRRARPSWRACCVSLARQGERNPDRYECFYTAHATLMSCATYSACREQRLLRRKRLKSGRRVSPYAAQCN